MIFPESHFHLDHLPQIDQFFIDEAHNAKYSWPSVDYEHDKPITAVISHNNTVRNRGIPIPTPSCTQQGVPVDGERHDHVARIVKGPSSFNDTKFIQDLRSNLGSVQARYLYNSPWSMYDWHQDLDRHESCINFVLTDTPDAKTVHRFPMDSRLNFFITTVNYKLYKPVLFNVKIDHCVFNFTDKHRYVLSVLIFDSSYKTAKDFLINYQPDSPGYL